MRCFSLKRAYFVVSSVISGLVLIGGFTLLITTKNDKDDNGNFEWARNLIAMIVTLWMPSPGESLKEMVESRNRNIERLATIQSSPDKSSSNVSNYGTGKFDTMRSDLTDDVDVGEPRHMSTFQNIIDMLFSPNKNSNNTTDTTDTKKDIENQIDDTPHSELVMSAPVVEHIVAVEPPPAQEREKPTEYKIQIEVIDD